VGDVLLQTGAAQVSTGRISNLYRVSFPYLTQTTNAVVLGIAGQEHIVKKLSTLMELSGLSPYSQYLFIGL
jgi:hypothetical protein